MAQLAQSTKPILLHANLSLAEAKNQSKISSSTVALAQKVSFQKHPFHLVDPSPWPLFASLGTFSLTTGSVMYFQSYNGGEFCALLGLAMVIYAMSIWWRDVIREATFEGHHTKVVKQGLAYGMILFIVSEIMFFVAFFWAFFNSSLSPAIELGGIWPPVGIEPIQIWGTPLWNPLAWGVPLWNTIILLTSGLSVTWAHHAILSGKPAQQSAQQALILTIVLAVLFTFVQIKEYIESPFSISDGIYGSTFYMATGFHGFHVFIGTLFLTVCLVRLMNNHFTKHHHFGFEAAAWYWHFVDVVWLFLFISIYWWGGN